MGPSWIIEGWNAGCHEPPTPVPRGSGPIALTPIPEADRAIREERSRSAPPATPRDAAMSEEDRQISLPGLTPEEERERTLAEVMRYEASRSEMRSRGHGPEPTTVRQVVTLAIALAVALVLWIRPPGFLLPASPATPPAAVVEANHRMAIVLQAQRIEHFRRVTRRLPDTLDEVGPVVPGLRYERLDANDYRLRAGEGEGAVTWDSTEALRTFAGSADRALGWVQ